MSIYQETDYTHNAEKLTRADTSRCILKCDAQGVGARFQRLRRVLRSLGKITYILTALSVITSSGTNQLIEILNPKPWTPQASFLSATFQQYEAEVGKAQVIADIPQSALSLFSGLRV